MKKTDKRESLEIKYVPIGKIKPMPGNPRKNETAVKPVADSIREFGWKKPILVRKEDNIIIAGHTRYLAAKLLGETMVPVMFTDMNEKKARAYNLADNKLGEIAEWSTAELASILDELRTEDGLLGIAGFDTAEVDKIIADFEKQNPANVQFAEHDESVEKEVAWVVCPKCEHKFPK